MAEVSEILFNWAMLFTETPNLSDIDHSESPGLTLYALSLVGIQVILPLLNLTEAQYHWRL